MDTTAESSGADLPVPRRGLVRLLYPVAGAAVLVAFMISSGIARNRARLASNADRHRQFVAAVRTFRDAAVSVLRNQQNADGSWNDDQSRLAATERILLNVRRAGYGAEAFYAAGLRYVDRVERERGATPWSRDETVLRWLLSDRDRLPDGVLDGLLEAHRTDANGLVSDLLLLGLLPPEEGAAAELRASLRNRMASGPRPAASWLTLGYFAWLASEQESALTRSLLPRFLEGFRSQAKGSAWGELGPLPLAAYVILLGEECLAKSDPCADANAPLGALVALRRPDGSWPSSALSVADGAVTASVPETTAVALSALTTFERVLDFRMASK